MKRFKLERSQDQPWWWVLTDTESLVVSNKKHNIYGGDKGEIRR